jgi:hypothetical protein
MYLRSYESCRLDRRNESRTHELIAEVRPPVPIELTDLALLSPEEIVEEADGRSLSVLVSASADLGRGICRSGDVIDALWVAVTAALEGERADGKYPRVSEISFLKPAICSMTFGDRGTPFVGSGGVGSLRFGLGRAGGIVGLCKAGPVGERVATIRRWLWRG